MTGVTQHYTTNDGVQLAYESAGSSGPVIVLIHGWSGSRKYFQRNIPALAAKCRVYAVDLRHHGDSSSVPARGFHIARLAADLRDFLEGLSLTGVTGGGSTLLGPMYCSSRMRGARSVPLLLEMRMNGLHKSRPRCPLPSRWTRAYITV